MDSVRILLSSRLTAAAMQKAPNRTKPAKPARLNAGIAAQYTRLLRAVALQQMPAILDHESLCAISLPGDARTHPIASRPVVLRPLCMRLLSRRTACAADISWRCRCSTAPFRLHTAAPAGCE